jgi:outer membrane protein assembly factor BamB
MPALALTLAVSVSPAPSREPETATFRADLGHSGVYLPGAGPALSKVLWSFPTRGPVRGSPVLAGNTVLFGSGDGHLYALDAGSGRERWRASLGGAVASSPAVRDGTVFATSRERSVTALDLVTGAVRWRFETGPDLPFAWGWDFWLSSPAVSNGTVYVGSGDGRLYALDARTGRRLWSAQTGGRVRSSPAVADGVVYAGSMDGKLYALDAATGKEVWVFEAEGASLDSQKFGFDRTSIVSSPAVTADLVFVGSRDAHLYAVDRKSGRQRWSVAHKIDYMKGEPAVSWVLGSPAFSDGRVFVGSSDGRFFHAVRADTGEEVWRFKTPGNVLSSAALSGGRLFFGGEEGHLFALDATTGTELWRFRTGGAVISSPAVGGAVVYVGSDDGRLYALATASLPAGARTRKAVYWKEAGPQKWFQGDVAARDYFRAEGYEVLDPDGLGRFLADTAAAPRAVLVMASDSLPPAAVAGPSDQSPLRRYLVAGGRVVWLGLPPDCFERDPQTGEPVRYDPSRTKRLLEVDHSVGSFDWMGATATPDGRRWGLPEWGLTGFGVPRGDVSTVLAVDEFGLATAWVKSFGGPPGSGFVRLWGREAPIPDLSWVQSVAEHVE